MNASTGMFLWNDTLGTFAAGSPAVIGGVVYDNVWEGMQYAVNASTGAVIWSYPTMYSSSSPVVADGLYFVGGGNQNCIALNATTGTQVWNFQPTSGTTDGSPIVSGGVVYICSCGNIYALNESTGALIWSRFAVPGGTWVSPTLANGVLCCF